MNHKTKRILSIILLSPIILCVITLDIIKLPFMLIVTPLSFLYALSQFLREAHYWFNDWIDFNLEFVCLTYLMKDDLF